MNATSAQDRRIRHSARVSPKPATPVGDRPGSPTFVSPAHASLRSSLLATVLLSSLLVFGCETTPGEEGESCTTMGCGTPYGVDFQMTGGWSAGDYSITADRDGVTTVCKATLPFDGCDNATTCAGADNVLLMRSGCALDASQHKLTGIMVANEQPKTLKVTVKRAAEVLGEGSWNPTFTTSRPNGPTCEPVCVQAATEKLTLK